ncbi:MAG TPA: carboxypeptidase-like regulatory domain-containing protein, partial [Cyclobacteriaceae bacterium]
MKMYFLIVFTLVSFLAVQAQTTQTLRGRVIDEVSKSPLIGVTILLVQNDQPTGSTTDADGYYILSKVPVGRQTLKISYVGFEEKIIPNIIVTAGKEVVLNVTLTESVSQLSEVVVISQTREDKTATNND